MSDEVLEQEYDLRASVNDPGLYLQRRRSWSEEARRRVPTMVDLQYGPAPRNTLDVLLPLTTREKSPLLVYLHGGYWRSNNKEDSSYIAASMAGAGVTCAVVEYPLLPSVTMDQLVADVRLAMSWLGARLSDFGCRESEVYVAGHSSGAHLAAMLAARDWEGRSEMPAVKGACLISGLYDLQPIRRVAANAWARLEAETAHRNSPIHHLPDLRTSVVIAFGSGEPEALRGQSRAYARVCEAAGVRTTLIELKDRNHYETAEELHDTDSIVTAKLLQIISE